MYIFVWLKLLASVTLWPMALIPSMNAIKQMVRNAEKIVIQMTQDLICKLSIHHNLYSIHVEYIE